jgi:hypothetical protein
VTKFALASNKKETDTETSSPTTPPTAIYSFANSRFAFGVSIIADFSGESGCLALRLHCSESRTCRAAGRTEPVPQPRPTVEEGPCDHGALGPASRSDITGRFWPRLRL